MSLPVVWLRRNQLTKSSRPSINALSVRGAERRVARRRAPAAVFVLSIACSRLPERDSVNVWVNSRERRVAASISMKAFWDKTERRDKRGMLSICVWRRYVSRPPAADNIARLNAPRLSSVETSYKESNIASLRRLSKSWAGRMAGLNGAATISSDARISSGYKNSATPSRLSKASISASSHACTLKDPVDISAHAIANSPADRPRAAR